MKIDGPESTRATSAAKKTGKARKSAAGNFAAALSQNAQPAEGGDSISTAAPVNSLDALLAIQEMDDATRQNQSSDRQAKDWGEAMLDRLDEIRTALLIGRIPQHQLENFSNLLHRQKRIATDPRLVDLMSEIEVRAMIELAKFHRDIR